MLFIDSLKDEAIELLNTGFFYGLTTNPTIIRRDRPNVGLKDVIILLNSISGLHFFQGSIRNLKWLEWLKETVKKQEIDPEKFVIKLPWEPIECSDLISDIHNLGFKICATAVYTVNQYYLAKVSKIKYVAIYFDRMKRIGVDPFKLIDGLLKIRNTDPHSPRIIAASIKNINDANDLIVAGVDDLTLPLEIAKEFLKGIFPMDDLEKFEKDFRF